MKLNNNEKLKLNEAVNDLSWINFRRGRYIILWDMPEINREDLSKEFFEFIKEYAIKYNVHVDDLNNYYSIDEWEAYGKDENLYLAYDDVGYRLFEEVQDEMIKTINSIANHESKWSTFKQRLNFS